MLQVLDTEHQTFVEQEGHAAVPNRAGPYCRVTQAADGPRFQFGMSFELYLNPCLFELWLVRSSNCGRVVYGSKDFEKARRNP